MLAINVKFSSTDIWCCPYIWMSNYAYEDLNIPSTAYNALFSNVRSNFFCFWKLGALPSPKIVISFAYFIWIINQYSRREILNSEMLPFVDLTCNKIATNAGKNLIHVSFSTQLLYPLLAYSLTYSIRNNALLAGLYNY